jgi:DNA-directed RNA polymerase specialized sigma subunit
LDEWGERKFHLIAFLYEIIVKKLELPERKTEILNHRLGYSDKHEKLTTTEATKKLKVTSQAVYQAERALERDIRDVIKIFKGGLCGTNKNKPGGLRLHKERRRGG